MWTEITDLIIFRRKLLKFLQGVCVQFWSLFHKQDHLVLSNSIRLAIKIKPKLESILPTIPYPLTAPGLPPTPCQRFSYSFVTIPWAGPPSLTEFHGINNKHQGVKTFHMVTRGEVWGRCLSLHATTDCNIFKQIQLHQVGFEKPYDLLVTPPVNGLSLNVKSAICRFVRPFQNFGSPSH